MDDFEVLFDAQSELNERLIALIDSRIDLKLPCATDDGKSVEASEDELAAAREKLAEQAKRLETAMAALQQLSEEKKELECRLAAASDNVERLETENSRYRSMPAFFEEVNDLFRRYKAAVGKAADDMKRVISAQDVAVFIVSACSEEGLRSMYDYICFNSSAVDGDACLLLLCEIYRCMLPVFARTNADIRLISPSVGEQLEPSLHTAAAGFANSGSIARVLLPGYMYVNTGRIVHTALVRVG